MIVGGVDLLAKAEEQEKLLQESNNELEERRRRAEQLRKELEEKEVRIDDGKHNWILTKNNWTFKYFTNITFILQLACTCRLFKYL